MEKIMYPLWRAADQTTDEFRDQLLSGLCASLAQLADVQGLRLCVADSAVSAANGRRIESHAPLPDAMLSLWVDYAEARAAWEPQIEVAVARHCSYLVVEAEPLRTQTEHPCEPGERLYGMCHVVFMSPPASLDRERWLDIWKGSHTEVAIETQSTFGYRQNLVARTYGEVVPCLAIVEENFPPEAMTCDHAFYATGNDDAILQKHTTAMMESCARFIDFAQIDVIPMSEYVVKPLARA